MALKTNFTDDILSESMNGKRQYNVTENSNGTKSLEDVTDYQSVGSTFSAKDMNETNAAVNQAYDDMGDEFNPKVDYAVGDYTIRNNKVWKFTTAHPAGAWDESHVKATKILSEARELTENLTFPDGTGFYPDEQDGQKGYNTSPNRGADTFFPFSKGVEFTHFIAESQDKSLYGSISFDKDYPVVIVTGRGNKSISIKLSEAGVEQPASYSATNGDFYCCVYKNVKKENVLSYSLVGVSSTFTTMVNVAY